MSPQSVVVNMRPVGFALTLSLALFVQVPTSGQIPRPRTQPRVIPSMDGRDLFQFYCATCHGRDGTGHGPVAAALMVAPADLTRIASRSGGVFPRARITELVTGDEALATSAHGSREMPVWGPIFRALDTTEIANKVRIAAIVEYLESIQVQQ
jgi:mono/diheme cytochrome c family protein